MIVRAATRADADQMCDILNALIARGGTTAHRRPFAAERMAAHYIAPTNNVSCSVADADGKVLGFQSLVWARPDRPDLPTDWGIIATFARLDGARKGVGRNLFARTLDEARATGVATIDAKIRRENTGGQIFYRKLGFTEWADDADTVSKRYDL